MPEYPLLGHSDYTGSQGQNEGEPWWKVGLRAGLTSLVTSPEFALQQEARRRHAAQREAEEKERTRQRKLQAILDQINKDTDRYEKERKDRELGQKLIAAEERAKTAATTVTPETPLAQGEQPYFPGGELATGPASSAERGQYFEQQMAMRPSITPGGQVGNIEQSALATQRQYQPPTEEKPKRITREDWHSAWSSLLEQTDGDTEMAWQYAPPDLKRAVNLYFPSQSPEKQQEKTKADLEKKKAQYYRKMLSEWQKINTGMPTNAQRRSAAFMRWFGQPRPTMLDLFTDDVYGEELAPLLDLPEYEPLRIEIIQQQQAGPPSPPEAAIAPATAPVQESEVSDAEAQAILEELRKTRELLEKLEKGE